MLHACSVGRLLLAAAATTLSIAALAQQPANQLAGGNPTRRAGKYAVELRLPPGGLYAGEEKDVEFRVTDASQDDPVLGAPPILNAKVAAAVTMPAMPSMPAQAPKTHQEGVPGDYGVVLYFPHGGDYRLDLKIAPPAGDPFRVSFTVPVADASPNRKAQPAPYLLDLKMNPAQPAAGQPTKLTIHVIQREGNKVVQDFDTVHTMKMHLMIVSSDLGYFMHEHPEVEPDGTFLLTFTFPHGGSYRVFADVAPHDAGSQVLSQPVTVSGTPAPAAFHLDPTLPARAEVDGMVVSLKTPADTLVAGRTMPLTLTVAEAASGAPVTDIQPWLGAVAHLVLIHQDVTTFVHSHPDETDPANGKQGTITFLARFPKAGIYRGWLQFQRGGTVHTAPFVVRAREAK